MTGEYEKHSSGIGLRSLAEIDMLTTDSSAGLIMPEATQMVPAGVAGRRASVQGLSA